MDQIWTTEAVSARPAPPRSRARRRRGSRAYGKAHPLHLMPHAFFAETVTARLDAGPGFSLALSGVKTAMAGSRATPGRFVR
jgi:hypothetical protein